MRARAVSGYLSKGPACFLVEIEGHRLLLDLGQGPDDERRPDLAGIGRVDAVLISHAHPDHVGALDLVAELGHPPIFATALTAELAQAGRFGAVSLLPLKGETEVLGLPVLTGRDGHAPGGVWMRIGGPEGLLYTGDFSTESGLYPFDPLPPAAALIFDASYGAFDVPLSDGVEALLLRPAGQPMLLPAPAGGRGLEMAMLFHARGLAVGLCPAHYDLGVRLLEIPDVLAAAARPVLATTLDAARRLAPGDAPGGIVIAANANGTGGLSRGLVGAWAERPEVAIVFTGHRAAGTPAKALVDAGRAQFQRWNVHPLLSALTAMLGSVAPAAAMPAFLAADQLPPLHAALAAYPTRLVAEIG